MEPDGKRPLSAEDGQRLDALFRFIQEQEATFVGYPCTSDFDYSDLYRFLSYPMNNVGDPFRESSYHLHTREFEREVLQWFAEQFHAPADDFWGYVTNGGTEGNLYGLYLARELFPDGMVYYSQDTHYSVSKNLRMLRMSHIMIKSQSNGEIDYDDLYETLRIHRDVPPILFANIGTTMKEAVDRVTRLREIIRDLAIPAAYIHADAALCGMTLPFIEHAPKFDFAAGIDSISVSGHKFIGSPIPCGIVLARKGNVDRIARSIEYVGSLDTTVTGSRNAISPLILWTAIHRFGEAGFRARVRGCLETADYAVQRFRGIGLHAWRNPQALTVVIDRPPEPILEKWQIAVQEEIAHVICMPQVTCARIDAIAEEIQHTPSREQSA